MILHFKVYYMIMVFSNNNNMILNFKVYYMIMIFTNGTDIYVANFHGRIHNVQSCIPYRHTLCRRSHLNKCSWTFSMSSSTCCCVCTGRSGTVRNLQAVVTTSLWTLLPQPCHFVNAIIIAVTTLLWAILPLPWRHCYGQRYHRR